MADTQSRTPGVIRSTREYVRPVSPSPASPDGGEPSPVSTGSGDDDSSTTSSSRDNPREIRNKAEKQRRDKLNQSIGELASMVPPVVAASRKIDKTGVLRLTAHYLRAHQYVFGETINHEEQQFSSMSTRALLSILNGFLLTTTYRGLIVVVSQNVQQYLGYSELDLLGQSVFNIIHEEDRQLMRDMLMPKPHMIGANGELLVPDEPDGKRKVAEALAKEKRRFIIRFKKLGQRSEPSQYVTCHIEGSLRKSDRACRGYNRCCQMVRRARARGDNPCNSGNDVVFVGIVRMATETFITESNMESCRMEYRTRHSIDGQIIQCERRISLVTGYMTHEVKGINAMNFMHRDDVRWVVIALREMYDQHRLFGESCYRLLTKNNQFIYMRTRGRLDVDPNTRAVTSFVCTNTVVDEQQGKHLIKMMKKKFTLMVNNNEETPPEEETKDTNDQNVSVEDPRQLEKVILHLVTNLPSPQTPEDISGNSPDRSTPPCGRLAIIPPKKERIVNAIEKIYSVIKSLPKELENNQKLRLNKVAPNGPSIVSNSVYMEYRESQSCLTTMTPTEPTTLKNNKAENQLVEYSNFKSMERSVVYTSQTITHNMMVPPDEVPSTSHSDTTLESLDGIHGTDHKQDNSINCHLSLPPTGNDDLNILNELNKPLASTSGVKRPRENTEYSEAEAVLKKKSGDALNEVDLTDPNILDETQLFESLFDDNIFNTSFSQLDTAVTSLEQTMDPSFPELLVPQEVQEILQAIENGPTTDLTET